MTHLRRTHAFLVFLFKQNLQFLHLLAKHPTQFPHLLFLLYNLCTGGLVNVAMEIHTSTLVY